MTNNIDYIDLEDTVLEELKAALMKLPDIASVSRIAGEALVEALIHFGAEDAFDTVHTAVDRCGRDPDDYDYDEYGRA